jgi:hypothetical protein
LIGAADAAGPSAHGVFNQASQHGEYRQGPPVGGPTPPSIA